MKNAILFFGFGFFFLVGCQNVEQYKTSIEELASKWDVTTESFQNLTSQLNNEISGQAKVLETIPLPVNLTEMSGDAQSKISEARQACINAGAGFSNILNEVNTFIEDWSAKGEEVANLKDGLAAGKLAGNVEANLAELTTFVTDADSKVADWTSKLEKVKMSCVESQGKYSTVLAELTPKKPTK